MVAAHCAFAPPFHDDFLASEPIDERVGYDVDAAMLAAWNEALAALAEDADAALPEAG